MSYLRFDSAFDRNAFAGAEPASQFASDVPPVQQSTDRAIDSALRSVPLPDGLMTRLGKLVYAMSEEAADQVDWLGC